MKYKTRRYFLYYLARAAAYIFFIMPPSIGLRIAAGIGRLVYYILGKYRKITLDNLRLSLGKEVKDAELRIIARRVFENLGKNAYELVCLPKINKSNINKYVEIKNPEILDEAFKAGNGIIIITAHFGNWELMAAALRLKGYPGVTVGRRIYFGKYDRYLNSLRRVHDVQIIYRDESPRKILKELKANRIVGIVADQDIDSVEGVFVDFLGRKAYTPAGPAALAKASGAALIPVFMIRKNAHHSLVVEKGVELADTGRKENDLIENTRRWSAVVESYVRRYPDQWVWMHRRWKTKDV